MAASAIATLTCSHYWDREDAHTLSAPAMVRRGKQSLAAPQDTLCSLWSLGPGEGTPCSKSEASHTQSHQMSKSYQTAHREALGCLAFCQEDTTQKQLPSSKEGITCGIQLLGTSRINGIAKKQGRDSKSQVKLCQEEDEGGDEAQNFC